MLVCSLAVPARFGIWGRFVAEIAQDSCRVPCRDGIGRNGACYYASGSYYGVFPNREIWENGCSRPNGSSRTDYCVFDCPVTARLRSSFGCGCTWIGIVSKGYAVSDEDAVFNCHTFAYEGMAGYLAIAADASTFLNLDESAKTRAVSNLASVEVDELR